MNLRLNAMLLALLTVLIAVLGDWSGGEELAKVWCLPAGLLLLGLAYESWIVRRSRVGLAVNAQSPWYLGRENLVRMTLVQQLRRTLAVELSPCAPAAFLMDSTVCSVAVPAASQAVIEVPVSARRLGAFEWPVQHIRVVGPLGLASWTRRLDTNYAARVMPDLARISPEVRGLKGIGDRSSARRGAGAELLQLRRYQPGDPPRSIDWKASARAQRLISRDVVEDQHLEVVVVIDAGRTSGLRAGSLDRFGHYVNVAASLAQHVVARGDLVGLVVYADRPLLALAPSRGLGAVTRLRKVLADARVTSSESNPIEAAMRVRTLVRQRSLVVMLTDLDDAAVASQLLGAVRLLLPKHLPFVAGLSSAAAHALANANASDWLDPFRALAAQEYCTGLDRKVQALRVLGAPALVARPEQLERAVLDAYGSFRQRRRV